MHKAWGLILVIKKTNNSPNGEEVRNMRSLHKQYTETSEFRERGNKRSPGAEGKVTGKCLLKGYWGSVQAGAMLHSIMNSKHL